MFSKYPDIVTVDNVCEMLHIGKSSTYSLLHNKQINHVKIGRKYIIPKNAVISFVDQSTWYNNNQIIDGRLQLKKGDIVP